MATDQLDLLDMEQGSVNGNGDGMGDMGELPLPLLAADAISMGPPGTGNGRDDRSWSEFLRRQQDIIMDSLWDFIRDHKPDSHEGRMVMQNVASAVIYTIMSEALQIKRRMDDLKQRDKELTRELDKDQVAAATAIFDRWSRGNRMQEYLVCIKHRYGFAELERMEPEYEEDENGVPVPVTSGPRWDWHNAAREMREADREAIFDLTAGGYELFTVWEARGRLRRQLNENRAKRLPDLDVSDWLAKVKSGKATNTEKLLGGTYLLQELVAFGLAHEGGDNPFWKHLRGLYRGVQEQASRGRSGWFRRRQAMGDGGDVGGDDA